ncbi:MAG: putative signal transducing protein [Gemmatimonadota bacterium]
MAHEPQAGGPVEVARFHWRHEAEMALGILEDEGIPGVVLADDGGGAYPGIGSARVVVPAEHADRARVVLGELKEGAGEERGD